MLIYQVGLLPKDRIKIIANFNYVDNLNQILIATFKLIDVALNAQ